MKKMSGVLQKNYNLTDARKKFYKNYYYLYLIIIEMITNIMINLLKEILISIFNVYHRINLLKQLNQKLKILNNRFLYKLPIFI